ncbi:Uu.00g033870.m01.CDS01 [Anthostomella pinea]|uniref:Uu.00g033870.m01.CDS01 n=1 Tax=Anthostomella pinea TaxID=933095 RepID=A0AAI8YAW9_9PEZI|nr:Uu.00g033870.m01.CDS01 [Anthostomella pinea]
MYGKFSVQAPPPRPPPRHIEGWPAGVPQPNEAPVNGINRVVISETNRNPNVHWPSVPIDPAVDRRFHLLASAINIGLEWHETDRGRSVLRRLGREVLAHWARRGYALPQPVDPNTLDRRVNYFLAKMRQAFPSIWISPELRAGSIASTEKFPEGAGLVLDDFRPPQAYCIKVNESIVNSMARNDTEFWRPIGRKEKQADYDQAKAKAFTRHQRFQFIFATAAFHELCHCFIGYLAQSPHENTPKRVTYLDYAQDGGGESGRWAERAFFGGSMEFYIDPQDGLEHIYILEEDEVAWQILPQTIREFISEPRHVTAAPAIASQGVKRSQRISRRFRPLGHNVSPPASIATTRTMMALDAIRTSKRYNLRIQELRMLPRDPRVTLVAVRA